MKVKITREEVEKMSSMTINKDGVNFACLNLGYKDFTVEAEPVQSEQESFTKKWNEEYLRPAAPKEKIGKLLVRIDSYPTEREILLKINEIIAAVNSR